MMRLCNSRSAMGNVKFGIIGCVCVCVGGGGGGGGLSVIIMYALYIFVTLGEIDVGQGGRQLYAH